MTLIDLEQDQVFEQQSDIKFTEGFLDLDFTSKSDLHSNILEDGKKDSGFLQEELLLESDEFEQSTEVVIQDDDKVGQFTHSDTEELVLQSVLDDKESGMLGDMSSTPYDDNISLSEIPKESIIKATLEKDFNNLAENLGIAPEIVAVDNSVVESQSAVETPLNEFADFVGFSAPKANSHEDNDEVMDHISSNHIDGSDISHSPVPVQLENFASFPSIEETLKNDTSTFSLDHTVDPSLQILSDLDQGLDQSTSESPLTSVPQEPLPRQSMTLNLHENEGLEEIQEKKRLQSVVEHKSWFSWRSLFCL